MAVTGGWTDETFGSGAASRAKTRKARRSLGAALRDAGLGDAAPEPHDANDATVLLSRSASAIAASRSPRLAVFAEPDEPEPATGKTAPPQQSSVTHASSGVVSPPPWLRAARRGRRHARMLNTFGWAMTLAIAGSIIGLAGRYLAVPPPGVQTTMQARQ